MKHLNACYTVTDAGEVKAIVLMEDEIIHTDERPRCDDLTCPCQCEEAQEESLIVEYPQG